jgi:ABC-2 type transport system ATP-binding protein
MTAWDNLSFFADLYRIPRTARNGRLTHYLRSMELWERKDDPVGTFSKGMKQKLALIRAVFHEPKVIFLDEPTAGLDPEAALMIREMILGLKSEGRTIVACTHNLDEAQRLADIVGIIKRRLLVCDTITNLQSPGRARVQIELDGSERPDRYSILPSQLPFVRHVESSGRTFTFELDDPSNTPRLIKALVDQSVNIHSVLPLVRSLEAIYLQHIDDRSDNQ